MVVLNSITTTRCPECGCSQIVSESLDTNFDGSIWVHTNGAKRENRAFACGYAVRYCPNFSREEVLHKCRFDKRENEEKARRAVLQKELIAHIDNSDCELKYKQALISKIQYGGI